MRVVDQNGETVVAPDLSMGHLIGDKIFVAHHPAVEAVKEEWHYEVVAEYPNGGKDLEKVIDVQGVKAADAWDEYEDVMRYVLYTEEELKEIESKRELPLIDRVKELEEALALLLSGDTE